MTHGGCEQAERRYERKKVFVKRRNEFSVRQVAVSCCYRIIWLTEFPFIMPTVLYFVLACDHMHKLLSYVFCRDWTQKPRFIMKDLSNIARGKRNGCRVKSCWIMLDILRKLVNRSVNIESLKLFYCATGGKYNKVMRFS